MLINNFIATVLFSELCIWRVVFNHCSGRKSTIYERSSVMQKRRKIVVSALCGKKIAWLNRNMGPINRLKHACKRSLQLLLSHTSWTELHALSDCTVCFLLCWMYRAESLVAREESLFDYLTLTFDIWHWGEKSSRHWSLASSSLMPPIPIKTLFPEEMFSTLKEFIPKVDGLKCIMSG